MEKNAFLKEKESSVVALVVIGGHLMGKSCSFSYPYVLFVMSICSFGCFQLSFKGSNLVLIV